MLKKSNESIIIKKIKDIENYSFDFLKSRFLKKFNDLDEYQYLLIEECLKDYYIAYYLINNNLVNINTKSISPPNDIVDELWHLHIIYTKDYFEFCENNFNHYLHHYPLNENDNNDDDSNEMFLLGSFIKKYRNYKLNDLNFYKNNDKFSLLSQINDYVNEIPYEEVLNK